MRCGLSAAVLIASMIFALPALAETGGPAAAAAAAAKAARSGGPAPEATPPSATAPAPSPAPEPASASEPGTATAPQTTPQADVTAAAPPDAPVPAEPVAAATPPAEAAAVATGAHDEGPPVPLATPAKKPADEVPADAGTSADAPPANQAVVPPVPDKAAEPGAATPAPDAKAAEAVPADKAQPSGDTAKPKLVAAKTLFGAAKEPAPLSARAIGTYARGCLSGAKPLAVDGPTWQAMRLSRNRTWGHPDLIALLERFAGEVKEDGWPGLLVGDISQPRGGPMLTGHASHQLGLDADIWFTPMPDRRLSRKERETLSATSMLSSDSLSVDPKVWSESRVKIIKRVASYPKVERVLVHPAIKKALCQGAGTENRAWLNKVRPYWGHFYHFHVRMGCPSGSPGCKTQAPVPGDDGCGKELDDWFQLLARKPKPKPPGEPKIVKPAKPKAPITLADLPTDCSDVLIAGTDMKLPTRPAPAVASTTGGGAAKAKPSVAKPAATKAPAKPKVAKPAVVKAPAAKPASTKSAATSEKSKKQ